MGGVLAHYTKNKEENMNKTNKKKTERRWTKKAIVGGALSQPGGLKRGLADMMMKVGGLRMKVCQEYRIAGRAVGRIGVWVLGRAGAPGRGIEGFRLGAGPGTGEHGGGQIEWGRGKRKSEWGGVWKWMGEEKGDGRGEMVEEGVCVCVGERAGPGDGEEREGRRGVGRWMGWVGVHPKTAPVLYMADFYLHRQYKTCFPYAVEFC